MISKELKAAREYEERESRKVTPEERPEYHFSPRTGWLNDPNGFSFYNGKYHLFYQYHPYSTYWGPMHWGHAASDDLIRWEYLPAAMAPDTEYDSAGCFSGSAITLDDGRQLLMYTGCNAADTDPDGKWCQTQCVAVSEVMPDGSTEYNKYENNPVITGADLPDGGDTYEFRDPYIYRTSDGSLRAVIANANKDAGKATQLCVYRSPDGFSWELGRVLFEDWKHIGIMWECPNLFPLGGRWMLIASPMNMEEEEADGSIRFPKGNNVCYITGDLNEKTDEFTPVRYDGQPNHHPVDCGLDFYAPQVMQTPDGRTVMIGWMQDPSTANLHDDEEFNIFCQMTIPRELSLKEDKLIQRPVRELGSMRELRAEYKGVEVSGNVELEGISGRILDLEVRLETEEDFRIRFAAGEDLYTEIEFDRKRSMLTIDRSNSGQADNITRRRSIRVSERGGRLDLRLLLDRHSAEIFVNGGEQVVSCTFYTPQEANGIFFGSNGGASMDVRAYEIHLD